MPRRVCRATIELLFVRILDIIFPSMKGALRLEEDGPTGRDGVLTDAGGGLCPCPRRPKGRRTDLAGDCLIFR
jgi:hypothetical protein